MKISLDDIKKLSSEEVFNNIWVGPIFLSKPRKDKYYGIIVCGYIYREIKREHLKDLFQYLVYIPSDLQEKFLDNADKGKTCGALLIVTPPEHKKIVESHLRWDRVENLIICVSSSEYKKFEKTLLEYFFSPVFDKDVVWDEFVKLIYGEKVFRAQKSLSNLEEHDALLKEKRAKGTLLH